MKHTRLGILICGAVVGACMDAAAPTTDPQLITSPGTAAIVKADPVAAIPGEYLVLLRKGAHDVATEARAVVAAGGTILAVWHDGIRGYHARLSPAQRDAIARRPAVESIEENAVVYAQASRPCAPYTSCSWGLDRIDETNLPMDGLFVTPQRTGTRVHAYVIDTGIRITHVEFGGRASYGIDVVDGDAIADDCNGHGTSMASLIGGRNVGVATGVTLVAVRTMDCSGAGTIANIVTGVNWVTANAVLPAVTNMSLGGGISPTMDAAINASIAAGITYVATAGSSNTNACNFSPAHIPAVITVGGTGSGGGVPPLNPDTRIPSSNIGPCLDLFAPGATILSASNQSDNAMWTLTGTSNSSAFTAGAAALYLDYFPARTPAQVSAAVVGNASVGVVGNPGAGSPNRLLNIGKPHRP